MVSGDRSPGGYLVQLTLLTQQSQFHLYSLKSHRRRGRAWLPDPHQTLLYSLNPVSPGPSCSSYLLLQRDIKEQWAGAGQSSAILCPQFPHLTQLLSSESDSLTGQQPVASPSSSLFG